mmetsp:Transcript_17406/g.19536  ORF Transcript_17406/g.19536 Transcript_17406/m.19536 type:complete len:163 (+) Transcript_17406:12-500(+)
MADKKSKLLLWKATETKKHDVIVKLFKKGISVNEVVTDGGMTGLHLASAQGDLVGSKLYLDNGADIDARDKVDRTPLHFAAANGSDIDLIDELVNRGADVNCQSLGGDTPLIKAIMFDNVDAVRALLDQGADQKIKNANERDAESFGQASRNAGILSALGLS